MALFVRSLLSVSFSLVFVACASRPGEAEPVDKTPSADAGARHKDASVRKDAATSPTRDAGPSADSGKPALPEPTPASLAKPPEQLSKTGLFADMKSQALGAGVEAYEPKYALWSDGADKRRWLRLPPGSTIDTSDMDYWKFPEGTKIWKEFSKDGKVLETRYMAKYGPDGMDWVYLAYQWNEAGTDAVAVPGGAENVGGTAHDIPSDLTCLKCHEGLEDGALGVGAIQLSHDAEGLTLATLIERGLLSDPPAGSVNLPGDEATQQALGYLHANCGTCHNPKGGEAFSKNAAIIYLQSAKQLGSVEQTTTYKEMVTRTNGNLSLLLKGVERMMSRPEKQMPPVASELVDKEGVALVDAWNKQLVKKFPQDKYADGGVSADAGVKPRDAGR